MDAGNNGGGVAVGETKVAVGSGQADTTDVNSRGDVPGGSIGQLRVRGRDRQSRESFPLGSGEGPFPETTPRYRVNSGLRPECSG